MLLWSFSVCIYSANYKGKIKIIRGTRNLKCIIYLFKNLDDIFGESMVSSDYSESSTTSTSVLKVQSKDLKTITSSVNNYPPSFGSQVTTDSINPFERQLTQTSFYDSNYRKTYEMINLRGILPTSYLCNLTIFNNNNK